ncbi:MAG: hypothetical protein M3P08_06800 [Thermoproteota archaeon]|nr:hypothetical protein [Thermoproteota archaeon]
MEAERLELSKVKETELFEFMKETKNKEEYRRASAVKRKLEGLPYRTIARNLDVNYRNVYLSTAAAQIYVNLYTKAIRVLEAVIVSRMPRM